MSANTTTVERQQQAYYQNSSSSAPAPAPQNVQRTQSTRTPHSRQTSTVSRTSSSANRDRDRDRGGGEQQQQQQQQAPMSSRRDAEYSTRPEAQTSSSSSSRRPDHSRQSSNMSELDKNGVDDQGRPTQPRSKKTTIQGVTGTWVLGKTIGAGSMGKVKIAKNQDTQEQCAIKIVPRAATERDHNGRASRDESKEIRTAREAAIVTLLDHPYICGMRDVVRTNNHWYMCFEYVNGGQMLDYIISHGRLKEKQARKFARQIASSLDYCHRNSIVHRDLKIENILISKTGDIKIIDFGLSNLFSPRSLLNTFCGSLYFAAPELLQARPYTGPEVDIWSFGIVLYVLVCGKVPFDDQSMPALHAKIKRGIVDYPAWLSADCKSLLSRMLVTDPRSRATLAEIMNHPWITKGASGPLENYLPHREALQLPLDPNVVMAMTGFEFGSTESISHGLTRVIESEDYQRAARAAAHEAQMHLSGTEKKKPFQFDFYKRRSSTSSRDTLNNASSELLAHPYADTLNAFHPLLSIYHLVKEKQDRERRLALSAAEASTAQALGGPPTTRQEDQEKALQVPIIPLPEIAHTSESSYEVKDEPPTGGRTRPRARTHGDDEMAESVKKMDLDAPSNTTTPPTAASHSEAYKRESTAAGLLRRFSTRKHSSKPESKPPVVNLTPADSTASTSVAVPRKSLSVRRTRDTERPVSLVGSPPTNNAQYLTPPTTADGANPSIVQPKKKSSKLGRSTSVSEVDRRKRIVRTTSDASSDQGVAPMDSAVSPRLPSSTPGSIASRAKSMGHGRRESYSHRRSKREETGNQIPGEVPEENDADLAMSAGSGEDAEASEVVGMPSIDHIKPIFLKGLLSVSTTTSKSPTAIRADIIRVLNQLGVTYQEIRGGFSCRHSPSIDLKSVVDNAPQSPEMTQTTPGHRRKISFGGDRTNAAQNQASPMKKRANNNNNTGETSAEDISDATSTQIQSELGGSMVLQFEIYIVRVPLMNLYGIQQKKMSGNTWSYKNMITKIISELRL